MRFKGGMMILQLAFIISVLTDTSAAVIRTIETETRTDAGAWPPSSRGLLPRDVDHTARAVHHRSWELIAQSEMTPRPVPLRTCPFPDRASGASPRRDAEAARRLLAENSHPEKFKFSLRNADAGAASQYVLHHNHKTNDGWYGKVAAATHRVSGEEVVIKQAKVEALALEAALLHVFQQSEGIMNIKDVIPLNNNSGSAFGYIVLEKMDDYAVMIRNLWSGGKDSVPQDDMRRMVLNLVLAVHHMHKNFVLHGDLKSGNVMYQKRGCKIKLIDTGLSLPYVPETGSLPVYGTDITGRHGPAGPEWLSMSSYEVRNRGYLSWDRAVQAELFALGEVLLDFVVGPKGTTKQVIYRYMKRRAEWDRGFRSPKDKEAKMCWVYAEMVGRPSHEVLQRDYSERCQRALKDKPMKPVFPLSAAFPNVDKEALSLVESLMNMDRTKRPTTHELLRHPYFAGVIDDAPNSSNTGGVEHGATAAIDKRVQEVIQHKRLNDYVPHGSLHTEEDLSRLYGEIAGVYESRHAAAGGGSQAEPAR